MARNLPSRIFPVLGLWHSFKQSGNIVWRDFGDVCLKHIWDEVFPGKIHRDHNKYFASTVTYLTYLRCAWKDAGPVCLECLEEVERYRAENKKLECKTCNKKFLALTSQHMRLRAIRDLFEFFIPTVRARHAVKPAKAMVH